MGDENTGHIKKDKNKRARKKKCVEESSADSDSDDSHNSSIKSGKNGKHCQSNYVDYGSEDSADFSGSENSDVEDEEEEVEEEETFQFYEDRNASKVDYEIDIASGSDSPDTESGGEDDDESDSDNDTNYNDREDKAARQLLNAKSVLESISTPNGEENKNLGNSVESKIPLSKKALKRLRKKNSLGNITVKSEKSVSDDALVEANTSVALDVVKEEPVALNANDSLVKSESSETEEVEMRKKCNVVRAAATQRKRRVIDDDDDSD